MKYVISILFVLLLIISRTKVHSQKIELGVFNEYSINRYDQNQYDRNFT